MKGLPGGIRITRQRAWEAALEAGDRSAIAANRKIWDHEDYLIATALFGELWPVPRSAEEPLRIEAFTSKG